MNYFFKMHFIYINFCYNQYTHRERERERQRERERERKRERIFFITTVY